jgi:hypothetical protein
MQGDFRNCRPVSDRIDQIETVLGKLPAPIIHNKRLGELLYSMMQELPELRHMYRKPKHLDMITCHDYPHKSLLESSLDLLGINGYKTLREPFKGHWRNTYKLKWVLNYLERTADGPEYVLFCDADDTILKGDPQAAIDILHQNKCKLLFMSTSFLGGYACMPQVKQWADTIHKGRYLNSGVFIGHRAFIVDVLREADQYISDNDITAEESRMLGHGVLSKKLCERLPEYPKGSQDQDILRYIHPLFFPDMQIDYGNELAFRNI